MGIQFFKYRFLMMTVAVLFIPILSIGQNRAIDSLKAEINKSDKNENEIAQLYLLTAQNYSQINIYDSTLKYARLALSYFKKNNTYSGKANAFRAIGSVYETYCDYDSSIVNFQKAAKNYIIINDTNSLSETYGHIGLVYNKLGNYKEATTYALKNLSLAETVGDSSQIAWASNLLGSIYWYLYDNDNALKYYKKSLEIYTKLDDIFGIARANLNIGGVFQDNIEDGKAIEHYANSLKAFKKINEKRGIAAALVNLGSIYYSQKKYKRSLEYLGKAIIVCDEIGDTWRYATAVNRIGKCYFQLGEYKKAKEYFLLSLESAKKINATKIIKDSYENLAFTDSSLGNYLDAYQHYKIYSQLKDSIFNIEKSRQITEINTKYETEKKEKEIELLNKEKEINRNRLIIQKAVIYSIGLILILLAASTFLLFKRIKEKQRTNNLLSSKNKEIQEKQTEIENQNKKLEEQADKLSELDELKTRFFTNISHEFRTPLTLIIGPVEQLLQKVKEPEIKNSLNLMLRNANKLLDLINQLLEISKIERGNVKLKFQKDNIEKEVHYIIEMFSSMAAEKKLELEFKSGHSDFEGYLDKEKFHKIISNLLSNAFKHTQQGKISLELKNTDTPGKIQIIVSDTGVGIHHDKLPYIFDRFYQVDTSENEETAGTGIGLSFIKELIYLYKGEITAQSEPNKGTKFIIELPVTLDFYTEEEYEIISSEEKDLKQLQLSNDSNNEQNNIKDNTDKETILIVEDHSDLRGFIVQNLINDYQILEASNGEEGIAKALKKLPDIIITDIMMPKVTGIELTKTLKNNEITSHIPIIMLTAKSSIESKIEGLETEADDYLTKPFNIQEVRIRIKNLLKIRRKLQEKYNKSITVNPSEITTTSVDEKFLTKLLNAVEDNMNNSELSVEMLCDIVGMSRANIHKKLKSLVNQSATEFINSIRLKRAAQLIQQNAGNISEIAYDVGFNNLSYFSRAFKKHFNMTPKEMMGDNNS